MVSVWLWKLANKPKLLALLDHLPHEDAAKIRSAKIGIVTVCHRPMVIDMFHGSMLQILSLLTVDVDN